MVSTCFAEQSYYQIQKICNSNGYSFFFDLTKEQYLTEVKFPMFIIMGWIIRIEQKVLFISNRDNTKWTNNYLKLHVFHDFEGTGGWGFAIEKNGETSFIERGCV